MDGNAIHFDTAGSLALTIDSSQNLTAAGTASAQTLTVNGPSDANARLNINAGEGRDVEIYMAADEGDDNDDKWKIIGGAGNIYFSSYTSGSWVTKANIKDNGSIHDSKGNLRSIPKTAKSATYAIVAADAGTCLATNSQITVQGSQMSEGDAVTILNNSGSSINIVRSSFSLFNTGNGNDEDTSLGARGIATIYFLDASNGYISGSSLGS